jgi:hypothetical protein
MFQGNFITGYRPGEFQALMWIKLAVEAALMSLREDGAVTFFARPITCCRIRSRQRRQN